MLVGEEGMGPFSGTGPMSTAGMMAYEETRLKDILYSRYLSLQSHAAVGTQTPSNPIECALYSSFNDVSTSYRVLQYKQ